VELGINFIDTAWFYGPLVANRNWDARRIALSSDEVAAIAKQG
jgi:aryl-alcohol dehydrogenase-like predicted oxidoreductase